MSSRVKFIKLVGQNNFIHLQITGKLEKEDYDVFVPEIERQMAQYGKVNLLVELVDFHGWTAAATWEDTKFGLRHFNDIHRLAIVGDSAWEKGMAFFCKAFTRAEVKYFDLAKRSEANIWVTSAEEAEQIDSENG